MKKMVCIFLLLAAISCAPSANEERKNLYNEVIEIHDEVMPRMDEIFSLQSTVKSQIDSLRKIDTTLQQIEMLNGLHLKLEEADQAMMNWMRAFKVSMNSDEVDQQEAIHYFEAEREKIIEVRDVMNRNIDEAQQKLK